MNVNRPFTTWTEVQIRFLFTRKDCLTLVWQDIVNTVNCTGSSWRLLCSSYSSSAKLFANVSHIGNILLLYTLWTAGFQIPLSPKNASKVIFNAREVFRCRDIAKSDFHVSLLFMFLSWRYKVTSLFFRSYFFFFVCFHLRKENTCRIKVPTYRGN